MKVNRLITRIVVRAFFLLLLVAVAPALLMGDKSKLGHIYLAFPHAWEMIFPVIIIVAFVTLLIMCAVKKFNEQELNFLLVVNTIVLAAYGTAIFIRVYHMV